MKFDTMEEFSNSIKQCIADDEDGEYFAYSDILDNLDLLFANFDRLNEYLTPSDLTIFLNAVQKPGMVYSSEVKKFITKKREEIKAELQKSHLSHYSHFDPIVQNQKNQLPSFPVDMLPVIIKTYIKEVSESIQVPDDMVASMVLIVMSLCIQGKFYINIKPDWTESLNLYVVVVGRPSERKSPTLKEVTRPIFQYVSEENKRRKPLIAEYELKKKILSGKLRTIQEALSRKGSKPKYTLEDAIDCQKQLEDLEEVKALRLIVDDVTSEALVKAMKDNGERMGIISAEGGIFGMMAGRYNTNTNIDIFLKGYSGEYYSSIRVGRAETDLTHPYLTIGLMVQPQVIEDIMDNKDFRGKGLLARFLYTVPNTKVGERVYRTKEVSGLARKKYEDLCKELLDIPDLTGFTERVIRLSPEADKLAEEFYMWIEHQLTNELEEIEDWAGKLHGNTMRIAGVLHIIKHKLNSVNVPVEEDTMRSAIEIGKYYLEHSKVAFDIMGLSDPPEIQDAKYIISRLGQNDLNDKNDFIPKREAIRLCQKFKTVEEMEPGLRCLEEHGYIAIIKESQGRGRPSEKICINPEYYKWKESNGIKASIRNVL